ncbi:hypothetical protein A5711_18155 [Mycobacterium sp. E2238]|nr:hypothetical protein A5711_18155 [Mycobacterium sp. E2238]
MMEVRAVLVGNRAASVVAQSGRCDGVEYPGCQAGMTVRDGSGWDEGEFPVSALPIKILR